MLDIKQQWKLAEAWNLAAIKENKNPIPRDYIYASELLYPKIDRFLKMRGVEYTNPPNDRSRRKFFAGNVWEYVVRSVLITCGIYRREEMKADATPFEGMLPIHGRYDFLAGGTIDRDEARARVEQNGLPDFLHDLAYMLIDHFAGRDLSQRILEVKSVAQYTLDMVEMRKAPVSTHHIQAYHYQRTLNLPASIAYISKDNALMAEFFVNAEEAEKLYKEDIVQMTYYFTKGIQPAPEVMMAFDYGTGKFSKNLGVEYSPYLSMVYGFASPDEYRRSVEPKIKQWNNVVTRYAQAELGHTTPTGKPLNITPLNKQVRQDIIDEGYDFMDILQTKMQLISSGVEEEEVSE